MNIYAMEFEEFKFPPFQFLSFGAILGCMENMTQTATFGVAGNFTGHLEQAGEAIDFRNVKTAEANAPKALFPTYIPGAGKNTDGNTPAFLGTFPFDSKKIIYPENEEKLQIEPECAIVFKAEWKDGKISALIPVCFGASNDCSIRKAGAKKISEKKNWGPSSKGFASKTIPLDSFDEKGILSGYRIASFLVRGKEIHAYGEDSAVRDYSYVYGKLTDWIIDKLNNQKDEGPAENVASYLAEAGFPKNLLVSIGATRYTEYGEHNFLQKGDISAVIVYPESKFSQDQIAGMLMDGSLEKDPDTSILLQEIC